MALPTLFVRAFLAIGAALCLSAAASAEPAAQAGSKRVEAIFSYNPSHPGTAAALKVVEEVLAPRFEVFEEFMDTKRLEPERAFRHMAALLRDKHAEEGPPALVLCFDDNALIFADRYREELFGGAPIVFAGVNSRERAVAMDAKPAVTGVFEDLPIGRTIELAKRLNRAPLRRVVAIVDGTTTSRSLDAQLAAEEQAFPSLTFERLSLERHTLAEAAQRLSEDTRIDTAYLFLAAYRDAAGKSVIGSLRYLQLRASRPIYTFTRREVEGGATAGHVSALESQARIAVEMAERVLGGEDPDAIPVVFENPSFPLVDEVRAQRFGLRLDQLANNAVRLRRMPSFWEKTGALARMAAILTGGSAAILALFLIQNSRARRRLLQAHDALRQQHAELIAAKLEIERQSLHDHLTGLPNRRYLERRLDDIAAEADANDTPGVLAVLHLDLDRFKAINDTFGHLAGDRVLQEVAERLRRRVPPNGFVARQGGDEFLCLGRFASREEVRAYAARLQRELSALVDHDSRPLRFGVSVGVAVIEATQRPLSPERLLQQADIALYRSKVEGRGRVTFFTERHALEIAVGKELEDDVARGLEADEFVAWYQPQVCARTGVAVGVEALARWRHPARGVLAPGAFLEAADRLGALPALDARILRRVAEDLRIWRAEGVVPSSASVNVSPRRLTDPVLAKEIATLDFGETQLICELLESIFLDGGNPELDWAIDRLRESGAAIEIDDFGTGHASIVSLLSLRPDRLKIARELIAPIDSCETRLGLVRAIMDIAEPLGINVIAEGIERPEQLRLMRELGCERLQGMAISPPLPPERIPAFFRAHAPGVADLSRAALS